eukprot:scaffold3254_cov273-Prasinococcus_capsulatus_cf.AAC.5
MSSLQSSTSAGICGHGRVAVTTATPIVGSALTRRRTYAADGARDLVAAGAEVEDLVANVLRGRDARRRAAVVRLAGTARCRRRRRRRPRSGAAAGDAAADRSAWPDAATPRASRGCPAPRSAVNGQRAPRSSAGARAPHLEVGQGDARDLLVAGALQEALVAGLGVGAQVDEAVGHQPRQRRHDGVEPRVVDVDLHVAHPPRLPPAAAGRWSRRLASACAGRCARGRTHLVDGAHEDHAVGEDGALEEAEGLHAGAAVAAARVLLLHEPRDEHVVLEGVRVARGVRVEGVLPGNTRRRRRRA